MRSHLVERRRSRPWLPGVIACALAAATPALAIVTPDEGEEGNTEAVTLSDEVIRAPGRPKGFLFLDYYNNESVSVFAGGLSVQHSSSPAIPLDGGRSLSVTRAYTSKICREDIFAQTYLDHDDGSGTPSHTVTAVIPVRRGNSWTGYGWAVHLGRISRVTERQWTDPNSISTWNTYVNKRHFVEPDGTDHRLHLLGGGEWGTADGSYIRATTLANGELKVFYPDGRWLRMRELVNVNSDPLPPDGQEVIKNPDKNGWYTVEAGRGSKSDFEVDYYLAAGFNHPEAIRQIRIPGQPGREITFDIYTNTDLDPNGVPVDGKLHGMLKAIRAPAFGGGEAVYTFHYDIYKFSSSSEKIPRLVRVDLPEGYALTYGYTGSYSPLLNKLVYPTGSRSEYAYGGYFFKRWDPTPVDCVPTDSVKRANCYKSESGIGVHQRRVLDGRGRSFSWSYGRSWIYDPPTMRVWQHFSERDPYGNVTEYDHYGEPAGADLDARYGRVKEVRVWKGTPGTALMRRELVEQQVMCSSSPYIVSYGGTRLDADVRETRRETRLYDPPYPSDPDTTSVAATLITEKLDWNGLGRFYTTRTSGTGIKGTRESFMLWTPDLAGWMLHEYTVRDTVENGTRARVRASFDGEGRIASQLTYRNILGVALDGGSAEVLPVRDPNDVLPTDPNMCSIPTPSEPAGPAPDPNQDLITDYTYDPNTGNLSSKKLWFNVPASFDDWDDPVTVRYEYQNGSASRVTADGIGYNLGDANNDLTGLPVWTQDASGVRTNYAFDALGRRERSAPATDPEEPIRFVYAPAGAAEHFTTAIQGGTSDVFVASDANQIYSNERYDGLGRTHRVEKAMPGGDLAVQETAFAPTGEAVFVSEWIPASELDFLQRRLLTKPGNDPANSQCLDPNGASDAWCVNVPLNPTTGRPWGTLTFYGEPDLADPDNPLAAAWDPMMRVHRVVAADGATTDTTYRALSRTVTVRGVKVGTDLSSLQDPNTTDVSTTYWEDGTGRLLMVDAPAASADAVYGYDLLGNLTKVNLAPELPPDPTLWGDYGSLLSGGQERSFLYDGIGRLVEAVNPENGTVRNGLFNVRGQPGWSQDARGRNRGYRFDYRYDVLGRPTEAMRVASVPVAAVDILNESFSSGALPGWERLPDPNVSGVGSSWSWYSSFPAGGCGINNNRSGVIRVGMSPCGYAGGTPGRDEAVSPPIGQDPANPITGMTVMTFDFMRSVRDTGRDAASDRLDRAYVEVEDLTDSSLSRRVFYLDSETPSRPMAWVTMPEIDLSEFKDHTIRLHFVFERTDGGDATRTGWAIDGVRVWTKWNETLWEKYYDMEFCSLYPGTDLCWYEQGRPERPQGKLSAVISYQGGMDVKTEYFAYRGPNGRLSGWRHRLPRNNGTSVADEFEGRIRYDALGQVVGLRAPRSSTEVAREYRPGYDRGLVVSLGDDTDFEGPSYVGFVAYNTAGGVRGVGFHNGASEIVDDDVRWRPARIRTLAFAPADPNDDFQNTRVLQPVLDTGTFEYDGAGNITRMGTDAFAYDEAMRLKAANVKGHDVLYDYDPFGNMTYRHMPNELSPIPAMEIDLRTYTDGAAVPPVADNHIHDAGFLFDENGNCVAEPADGAPSAAGSEPAKRFVFDALNRLKEVWVEGPAGFIPMSRSVYDASGMRLIKEDGAKAGRLTYYLRDTAGQVMAEYVIERGFLEAPYRSKEYLHGMGRILGVNDFCGPPPFLMWDSPKSANGNYRFKAQVPAALQPTGGYEMEIRAWGWQSNLGVVPDPNGRFEVPASAFSQTALNYIRIRSGAQCGTTVWSNQQTLSINGAASTTDTPPKEFDVAEPSFFHVDHLGSVRLETDPNGTLMTRRDFYPFGREMTAAASENNRRFTGHERDVETALDYMLARYYASTHGRFASPDPHPRITTDTPQAWNRYAYVRNNPINLVDPRGLADEEPSLLSTLWDAFLRLFSSLYDIRPPVLLMDPNAAPPPVPIEQLPNYLEIAEELNKTLDLIDAGGPFPHPDNDDQVFENDERRLPPKPENYYREYTVDTPDVKGRGQRRVVRGDKGELY